jgi:hypothetical protein
VQYEADGWLSRKPNHATGSASIDYIMPKDTITQSIIIAAAAITLQHPQLPAAACITRYDSNMLQRDSAFFP